MYPMIISVDEVRQIKAIVEEVKAELTEQGIEYGNPAQDHDRDTGLCDDEPGIGRRSRFLQYRY